MSNETSNSQTASGTETYNPPIASDVEENTSRQTRRNADKAPTDSDKYDLTRVITKCYFKIRVHDFSLMNNDNTNVTETETPFNANFRLVRSPVRTAAGPSNPGPSNAATICETQQMHDLGADSDENLILQDVIRKIKKWQTQIHETEDQIHIPRNTTTRRLSFHKHVFDITHDRYLQDIRNQRLVFYR